MKHSLGVLTALALVLSACSGGKDKGETGNDIDPAVSNALEDQIMVDPNLVGQANRFGRTGSTGSQASVPAAGTGGPAVSTGKLMKAPTPKTGGTSGRITLGQLAKEQAGGRRSKSADCDKNFQFSAAWATKMPAAFPLYPDAQVTEAAGNNDEPCRMRLVSFASKAPLQTLVDFYYTQAVRNGFNSEHQLAEGEHILAGARDKDDGAYYLTFNARKDGGTDVDMIVNHGQ
jgi:hypothetical protein